MADDKKAGRPLGPTGNTVKTYLRHVRDAQGISGTELSTRLEAIKRPIPPLGIQRIEGGSRRVDVDDLVSIAAALEVSPMTLLMPASNSGDDPVTATGTGELSARELLAWLIGEAPLPQYRHSASMYKTLPEWFIEERNALSANDIQWQMDLQNEISQLKSDNSALTETTRRQAAAIEILVEKLAELGVEVRPTRGDD